jgi:exodeoxyribonuclease V beta subunit
VVLAPNLDLDTASKTHVTTEEFRSETDGLYYFEQRGLLTQECEGWRTIQAEQENRRLLYVALTRAKYKCYVISYQKLRGGSTVKNFITALKENKSVGINDLIHWEDPSSLNPATYRYRNATSSAPPKYLKADGFSLLDMGWKKMSYSALNPPHQIGTIIPEQLPTPTPYDRFIFEQLKKGAHTGNLLHYIFEQADFTNPSDWKKLIHKAARRLGTSIDDNDTEGLYQMMQQVLQVDLPLPSGVFSLSSVANNQKMNELEFDFPVQQLPTKVFENLSPANTPWQLQAEDTLQGIMNGKMDLFFEHNGKYYILDWKSNHLGYQTEDYARDKVADAMTANNYHLQYHLYTVALCLYLRWRLPDFDYDKHFGGVIYLFVRGIRIGEENGIFYHQPERRLIEDMLELFGS